MPKKYKTLCFNYCATVPPIFKVSIQHQKSEGEKALKLNKHNQFNHTPKMVKSIYLLFCEKLHTIQSQVD